MTQESFKIFIGSGEQSLLERKVLIYSLKKNTQNPLDIYVMNGTHNSIERNDEEPFLAPMPLRLKYRNETEFSLYRYLIPDLCKRTGKAIYLDSDMICLGDIAVLCETPLRGFDFLARRGAFGQAEKETWGLSAMLMDCGKCYFDLDEIFREIDQGIYGYQDFAQMNQCFLSHHPYRIGEMDSHWNVFDRYDLNTRIIHYTGLLSQPWKYHDHPYGDLWYRYFLEARDSGYISDQEIQKTIMRGYVRPDILKGNNSLAKKSRRKISLLSGSKDTTTVAPHASGRKTNRSALKRVKKAVRAWLNM